MRYISSIVCLLAAASTAAAQVGRREDPQSTSVAQRAAKTIIEFELLADGPLAGGLHAHEWGETLQKLDASVQVRQPRADDQIGVTEKSRGTLRWVTVVGLLNSGGRLVLPDRTFARSDTELLGEWINELKLYGAQGAPEGKPLWGLSESQFRTVFTALSAPIAQTVEGRPLMEAVRDVALPAEYPVRFHSTAEQHLAQLGSPSDVRHQLAGVSCGTGLAAILADYGLGFRPLRTPAGEIELVVQPLADVSDPWPVGWDPLQEESRQQLAPTLFRMLPVKFDDVPLEDVFNAIAAASQVPVIVDHYAIAQRGIDLAGTTLSYPDKRVAWIQVLHSAAARNRMTEKLRIDELGRPFVHVTPFIPRPQTD